MADPLTPRSRWIRQSQLPRRTYQAALQRIYAWQWIHDRYVPGPSVTGFPIVAFVLTRAEPDSRSRLIQELRRSPGLAHCWALPGTVFSVIFAKGPAPVDSLVARLRGGGLCTEVWALAVDRADPGVSIYFDFEGEWSRYGGISGMLSYPHRLRDRPYLSADGERLPPSLRVLRITRDMVIRPIAQEQPATGSHEGGPRWPLRFVERSMIRHGWVEARSFLDPMAVARTLTDFAGGVTFVHGTLRTGTSPESLERQLLEGARVHPFLLASDERSALLAFLSTGPMTRLPPAPVPRETARAVIERHLEPFTVIREELRSGERIVAHRYDTTMGPLSTSGS